MKNICIVTGTRAEYGLLKPIIEKLLENKNFNVKIIATGSHLSKLHGFTIENIKNNFEVDYELNMLLANDSNIAIGKSLGIGLIGLSDYFGKNKFNGIILLGDRYEILGVATIATIFQIKIIHMCGGDTTEGAYDDNIRHAISQLSQIHLVTCEEAKKKIRSFGLNNVYVVGNPGLECLINFKPNKKIYENYIMFVYHSETKSLENMENDLIAIENTFKYIIDKKINLLVIGTNADNQNDKIKNLYNKYKDSIIYYESLDRIEYLNCAYHCNLFMGNSSSGIYEIPFFKKYVINIGNRQKGRREINNVINVECDFEKIKNAINIYYGKMGNNNGSYPIMNTCELIENLLMEKL
jgi:GDP/UDP-N,N'-diacetylbacillosamine 2-epimerase (hydrolysing)